MKKFILGAVSALLLAIVIAPTAHAATCGGWYSYNRDGEAARVSNVAPMQGMNCASSRYVVNKWLRPAYQSQYSNRIPTRFYDGYVTWYCHKTSGYDWRCDEYTSNTAFRFTAVYYG
jgi:hypothetical protein